MAIDRAGKGKYSLDQIWWPAQVPYTDWYEVWHGTWNKNHHFQSSIANVERVHLHFHSCHVNLNATKFWMHANAARKACSLSWEMGNERFSLRKFRCFDWGAFGPGSGAGAARKHQAVDSQHVHYHLSIFIFQHFDVSSGKFVDFAHTLPRLHFRYKNLKQEHLGVKQGNIFQALKALPMEVLNQKVWEDWVGWTWIHSENMKGHTASTHPPIIMEVKNESLQD